MSAIIGVLNVLVQADTKSVGGIPEIGTPYPAEPIEADEPIYIDVGKSPYRERLENGDCDE